MQEVELIAKNQAAEKLIIVVSEENEKVGKEKEIGKLGYLGFYRLGAK